MLKLSYETEFLHIETLLEDLLYSYLCAIIAICMYDAATFVIAIAIAKNGNTTKEVF